MWSRRPRVTAPRGRTSRACCRRGWSNSGFRSISEGGPEGPPLRLARYVLRTIRTCRTIRTIRTLTFVLYRASVANDLDGRANHLPAFVEPLDHLGSVCDGDAARDVVAFAPRENRLTRGFDIGRVRRYAHRVPQVVRVADEHRANPRCRQDSVEVFHPVNGFNHRDRKQIAFRIERPQVRVTFIVFGG